MKLSLSYHLTLFVLKLKGLKKQFSQDPIAFKKLRKEDVHNPKGSFFKSDKVRRFEIEKTTVTEVKQDESNGELLLFVHGGAFVFGPSKHHWDTVKEISKQTRKTVWMCDYPKAPEHKIQEISNNLDNVYQTALESYKTNQITLIGDSVGGTLITALSQRLVQKSMELPATIILVCPVMDASMSNPEIEQVDKIDPVLAKAGVLSAKRMCVGSTDLKDAMISPIYGSFKGFPKTILFLATHDVTYPDQKLAVQKLRAAQVDIEVVVGEKMPHIWPFLPVMKEAKMALMQIIESLNR